MRLFVLHKQNEPAVLIQTVYKYVNMFIWRVSLVPFIWFRENKWIELNGELNLGELLKECDRSKKQQQKTNKIFSFKEVGRSPVRSTLNIDISYNLLSIVEKFTCFNFLNLNISLYFNTKLFFLSLKINSKN